MKKILILLLIVTAPFLIGMAEEPKETDSYDETRLKLKHWAGKGSSYTDMYFIKLIDDLNCRISALEKKNKSSSEQ